MVILRVDPFCATSVDKKTWNREPDPFASGRCATKGRSDEAIFVDAFRTTVHRNATMKRVVRRSTLRTLSVALPLLSGCADFGAPEYIAAGDGFLISGGDASGAVQVSGRGRGRDWAPSADQPSARSRRRDPTCECCSPPTGVQQTWHGLRMGVESRSAERHPAMAIFTSTS